MSCYNLQSCPALAPCLVVGARCELLAQPAPCEACPMQVKAAVACAAAVAYAAAIKEGHSLIVHRPRLHHHMHLPGVTLARRGEVSAHASGPAAAPRREVSAANPQPSVAQTPVLGSSSPCTTASHARHGTCSEYPRSTRPALNVLYPGGTQTPCNKRLLTGMGTGRAGGRVLWVQHWQYPNRCNAAL